MKRDMELVRKILFAIEDSDSGWAPDEYNIEGYTEQQINYHALLIVDAGLALGQDISGFGDSAEGSISRLTWAGADFLDAVRNESQWKRAQSIVKEKVGSVTMDVLKALLAQIAKDTLGLPR
jgi:hypothetical protein